MHPFSHVKAIPLMKRMLTFGGGSFIAGDLVECRRVKSMLYIAKSCLYKSIVGLRRAIHLRKHVIVHDHRLAFTHNTEVALPHRYKSPTEGRRPRIVMYTDMVQFNSVCDYVLGLPRPATIVDVGAHHGLYAVTLGALSGAGGKVLAIEPEPRSFSVLSRNVVLNGLQQTVICEQAAASDARSTMTIVSDGSQSHLASTGGTPVRVEPLTELLKRHSIDSIDLLMIDVEGAELQVMRGFPWEAVPVRRIMCEMHPNDWHAFGCDPAAMAAFLSEHDLECLDMYFHRWEEFDTTSYIGPCLLQSTKAQLS